jgi:hypothetical protein
MHLSGKKRVKVPVDLPGDTTAASGEIEDKNADDYAFVSDLKRKQIRHWDLPPLSRLSPMSM